MVEVIFKRKISCCCVLLLWVALPAFAAPSIEAIDASGGTSLVVKGVGFGEKLIAAPYRFDHFEVAEVGQSAAEASDGFWGTSVNSNVSANVSRSPSSTNNSMAVQYPDPDPGGAVFEHVGEFDKLFVNFWVRIEWGEPDLDGSWQFKYFRLDSVDDSGGYEVYPSLAGFAWARYDGTINRTEWQHLSYDSDTCSGKSKRTVYQALPDIDQAPAWINVSVAIDQTDWQSFKSEIMQSQHGFAGAYYFNSNVTDMSHTCDSRPTVISKIKFGGSGESGANGATFYFDDIYIDTTWSRVEIGDSSVYGSCSHREMLIPSSWSDSSITVAVNQGSFSDDSKVYLFVVDADGKVNETGYPIIISKGAIAELEAKSTPELETKSIPESDAQSTPEPEAESTPEPPIDLRVVPR